MQVPSSRSWCRCAGDALVGRDTDLWCWIPRCWTSWCLTSLLPVLPRPVQTPFPITGCEGSAPSGLQLLAAPRRSLFFLVHIQHVQSSLRSQARGMMVVVSITSVRSTTVAAQAQEAQLPAPSSHWYANSAMSSAFILNSEQIQSYTCCALPMALL